MERIEVNFLKTEKVEQLNNREVEYLERKPIIPVEDYLNKEYIADDLYTRETAEIIKIMFNKKAYYFASKEDEEIYEILKNINEVVSTNYIIVKAMAESPLIEIEEAAGQGQGSHIYFKQILTCNFCGTGKKKTEEVENFAHKDGCPVLIAREKMEKLNKDYEK